MSETAAPSAAPHIDDETGEIDDERKFYCPGCGQRFDTAGICTGNAEAGHEPISVVATADAGKEEKTTSSSSAKK